MSISHDFQFTFENAELFRALCGVADSGVGNLEKVLAVELIPRGYSFLIKTDSQEKAEMARIFFEKVVMRFGNKSDIFPEAFDTRYLYRMLENEAQQNLENHSEFNSMTEEKNGPAIKKKTEFDPSLLKEKVYTNWRGKTIYPRTINQARYVDSIRNQTVTFGLGPAGTGKTFLAIAAACRMFQEGDADRIILTRPAVEAGESLGFLPGDLAQKVDPYLRPVYDALYECLGMEKVHDLILGRKIEIAPLAYMRGRTLNHAIIILDEAQNCTLTQLKMVLTRIGRNSHMCIGGDVTQVDLKPGQSGLSHTAALLRNVDGIRCIHFGAEDIIRNPIVERILAAFEQEVENGESENVAGPDSGNVFN